GRAGDEDAVEPLGEQAGGVVPQVDRSDLPRGGIERRGDGGEDAPDPLRAHCPGSRLDRSSVKPAGLSATASAGETTRERRRSVRICSSKSAGLDEAASAVSYVTALSPTS